VSNVVYRLYDQNGDLLYVGKSNGFLRRQLHHEKHKEWWGEVTDISLNLYPCRCASEDAERAAIRAEKPRYNNQHNRMRRYEEWLKTMPNLEAPIPVEDF
jgi:excinuclease UvrABC nuclease subunit